MATNIRFYYLHSDSGNYKTFEFHKYCDDYSWYEFDFIENVSGLKPEKTIEEFIKGISKNLSFK